MRLPTFCRHFLSRVQVISSYSFSSIQKEWDFKSQLTTEYDKEGRPTRIEETMTTLNKNNKQESSKYVTEYIW